MSLRRPAAINAAVTPVVDYAPDPRGHRLFHALVSQGAADLNNPAAVVAAPQSFSWLKSSQKMTGAASATAQGVAYAIAPRASELSRENTTTDDTTAAIFRSRMQRGIR